MSHTVAEELWIKLSQWYTEEDANDVVRALKRQCRTVRKYERKWSSGDSPVMLVRIEYKNT